MAKTTRVTQGSKGIEEYDDSIGGARIEVVVRAPGDGVGGTVVDTELTTADLDTGAGTDTRAVVGLALAESGGALLVGSAHPVPISAASSIPAALLPAALGQGTMAQSLRTVIASDQTAVAVSSSSIVVTATPVLDTNAYIAGDTLGALATLANVARTSAGCAILQSVTVIDSDNQGGAFDILLFNATVTCSAANAAWNTADSDMIKCQALVKVTAADYTTYGSTLNKVATFRGLGIVVSPAATSMFLGTVSQDTKTYTAAGLTIVLGFLRD